MDGAGMSGGGEAMFLGVSVKVVVATSIGGAFSAVLGAGKWWEKALRGVIGVGVAYVGHHVAAIVLVGLLDYVLDPPNLPRVDEMEPVAAFLAGLIGMVLCQAIVNAATAARDVADDLVEDKLGGK